MGFRAVGAAARWKEEGKAELNFRPSGFLGSQEQLPLPPQDEGLGSLGALFLGISPGTEPVPSAEPGAWLDRGSPRQVS